jgi:release factor glutamine methyltransferase
MTLGALSRTIAAHLERVGIPPAEAKLDGELLVRAALGWDRARWLAASSDPAPPGTEAQVDAWVARRLRREPMAYILGRCEFWGREFDVDRRVLIPRPETELLVEHCLAKVDEDPSSRTTVVADVGTGSGCIAVSLAAERPSLLVVATDSSAGALEVGRRNARRHGVLDRVVFRHGSLLAPRDDDPAPAIIVSNPPYVRDGDRSSLPAEVRDYEPAEALFAGPDGLGVIRMLVDAAAATLPPGGWLLFEFGFGQADAVRALLDASSSWRDVSLVNDLQGIPRIAVVTR